MDHHRTRESTSVRHTNGSVPAMQVNPHPIVEGEDYEYWNEAKLGRVNKTSIKPQLETSCTRSTHINAGQPEDSSTAILSNSILSSNDPRQTKYKTLRTKLESDPQWDFQHNNLINANCQSSANWHGDLLSPSMSKRFDPVINEREGGIVVWYEKEMSNDSGIVARDILWSRSDLNEFFTENQEEESISNAPHTLSDFLLRAQNNYNTRQINFSTRFPSLSNVTITNSLDLNRDMVADIINSLRDDVMNALISSICNRVYNHEKQVRFIDRFLQGRRYERYRIRKKYSNEVINIWRFPVPLARKWDELIIAVAEELPEGKIALTEGLSKNDEMRFIYQIYGLNSLLSRKQRTKRAQSSPCLERIHVNDFDDYRHYSSPNLLKGAQMAEEIEEEMLIRDQQAHLERKALHIRPPSTDELYTKVITPIYPRVAPSEMLVL